MLYSLALNYYFTLSRVANTLATSSQVPMLKLQKYCALSTWRGYDVKTPVPGLFALPPYEYSVP